MRRNSIGAVVSVWGIGEFKGQYMSCVCSICGEVFTPSDTEDCFVLTQKRAADGECPLSCERCHDQQTLAAGMDILDLSDPWHPVLRRANPRPPKK